MELMRIRRMFETLEVGSLVMLDELCSGTNPSEGEEIARLVISLLPELSTQVFVTTHLLSFAARLAEDRPIEALSSCRSSSTRAIGPPTASSPAWRRPPSPTRRRRASA